ncbi:MAG: hypothetical protein ACTJHU_06460 [Mycetocola sp.]
MTEGTGEPVGKNTPETVTDATGSHGVGERSATAADEVGTGTRRTLPLGEVLLAIPFALLLAYDVFEAIGNLIGSLALAGALDTSLSVMGWLVLGLGILSPVVLFFVAAYLGRGRDFLARLLVYLAAVALSAVISLNILGQFSSSVSLFV